MSPRLFVLSLQSCHHLFSSRVCLLLLLILPSFAATMAVNCSYSITGRRCTYTGMLISNAATHPTWHPTTKHTSIGTRWHNTAALNSAQPKFKIPLFGYESSILPVIPAYIVNAIAIVFHASVTVRALSLMSSSSAKFNVHGTNDVTSIVAHK